MEYKPGDIIGFSGCSPLSVTINLLTYGVPFWHISHVGIMGHYNGEILLFHSLWKADLPCRIQNEIAEGVQAHRIEDVIKTEKGKMWKYPLTDTLQKIESHRLTWFLLDQVNKEYDTVGAIRSAGLLIAFLESLLRQENLTKEYCSELVAAALKYLGILKTDNASSWNPNRLIRVLRRRGIISAPERLK